MIKVVLDTNIYSSDPHRKKAGFKALSKLINEFKVQLFIPEIVKREFISQRTDEYEKTVEKAQNSLGDILRKKIDDRLRQRLETMLKDFKIIKEDIISCPERELSDWLFKVRAENLQIESNHTRPVFDAYFKGEKPFRTKKSREDIPDAFILESIRNLSSEHDEIHAVIHDNNLRDACQQIGNVETYPSLQDFINSETVKPVLEKLEAIDKALPKIIEMLMEYSKILDDMIESEIANRLAGETITDAGVPDDNDEATISGVYEPDKVDYQFDEIFTFGDDTIIVPFNFATRVTVYYYVFKSEAYILDEERLESISLTDHNKHYYEAEEELEIEVQGDLSLQVNTDQLTKDFKNIYEIIDVEESLIEDIKEISSLPRYDY